MSLTKFCTLVAEEELVSSLFSFSFTAKKKKRKEKPCEFDQRAIEKLSFDFGKLNLKGITRKLGKSVSELCPSFTEYEGSVLTTKMKQSSMSQTTNKVSVVTQSSGNAFSLSMSGDDKHTMPLDIHEASISDPLDIPFSDRVKLRLEKRRKEHQMQDTATVNSVTKKFENLESKKKNGGITENLDQSVFSSFNYNLSGNSPLSPSVCSAIPADNSVRGTRKMSSPSSMMFCSPASYIKQSIENDCDIRFRNSPIQNNLDGCEPGQQRTPQTNFKFFDTPEKAKTLVTYDSTSPLTFSQNDNSIDRNTPAKPSMLKGSWQTEFIENYIHELSNDLSLNTNMNKRHNQHGSLQQCQSSNASYRSLSKDNTPNVPSKETLVLPSNETQEINFDLQSSLLNSLCASLIQTLTPKGMNRQQYESLCESLRKMEKDGKYQDTGLNNFDSNKDQSNLSFAEEKALEARQQLLSQHETKTINKNNNSNQQKYKEGSSGLGKSARKRQKRKQRKNINICGAYQNNENPPQREKASKHSQDQNACTSFHGNGNLTRHRGSLAHVDSCTEQLYCEQKPVPDIGNDLEATRTKKKKKKKKIKKAVSTIDISKDTSMLNESQYKTCSEYLQTALAVKPRLNFETIRLEKASPIIDISADDTFLELDVLSSCLTGDTGPSNTGAKQKLAMKKKLIEKQTQCNDTNTVVAVAHDNECSGLSLGGPYLSVNATILSPSKTKKNLKKMGYVAENQGASKQCVAEAIKPPEEIHHGQCLESDLNHGQGTDIVCSEAKLSAGKGRDKYKDRNDLSSADRNRENALLEIKKYCNAYCQQYRGRFAGLEEDLNYSDQTVFISSSGKSKDCAACCNEKSTCEYIDSRDFVKEECLCKATAKGNLPAPHETQKVHCCSGLNMDHLSNNNAMSDVYERNIQSCQGLGSWAQVTVKSNRDDYKLRCANKNSKLNYGYGLRKMQQKDNGSGCRIRSSYTPFPSDLGPHFSVNHNQICSQATHSHNERLSTMCEMETAELEMKCKASNKSHVSLDNKVFKTCLNDVKDDKIIQLYVKGKSRDCCENDNWTNIINNDTDKYLNIAQEIETSCKNRHTMDSSCKNDGTKQRVNDTSFAFISDLKPDEYGENLHDSDEELQDTDNTSLVDFVLKSKPMKPAFGDTTDLCKDISEAEIDSSFKEETDVCVDDMSEGSGDGTDDALFDVSLEDEESQDDSEAKINEVDDETESCLLNGNTELHVNSDLCKNTDNHVTESCVDRNGVEGIVDLTELDTVDISKRNKLDCKDEEKLENDTGGSSDKENERNVQNGESLNPAVERSDDITSGCCSKDELPDNLPSSAKVEDVQRGASPIPLLDRLKMKFKKASARSVLHSFTNGR